MVDKFVICNDRGPGNPWVIYVAGEELPNTENFDPRNTGVEVLAEVEVDPSRLSEDKRQLAAIQAVARLDMGCGRDFFRRALAKACEIGMRAQMELIQKEQARQGREALEQFNRTPPQVVSAESGQSDKMMGLDQESHSG